MTETKNWINERVVQRTTGNGKVIEVSIEKKKKKKKKKEKTIYTRREREREGEGESVCGGRGSSGGGGGEALCVLVCERGVKGCGEEEDVWYRREGRSLAVC